VKTRSHRWIVALAALVAVCGAELLPAADSYRVTAHVEPQGEITDTQPFQLVIQIEGQAGPQQVRPPDLPGVDGLTVIGGPHTNSRFAWTNGRATSSYQISYQLLAERPGAFEIPALVLEVDGQSYRTEALRITIGKGRDSSRGVTPRGTVTQDQDAPNPVFLEIQLGADEVWVGQPVPLTVTLFTALRVTNVNWRAQPSFTNFWVEKIDVNPEAEAFRRRINDRIYTGYPVERRMLVPPSPGEFKVEPYVAQMQVRQSGGDVFDIFSFGRTHTIVRKTPELTVKVKQLPPGQPEDFGGAVGRFSLDVTVDRDRAAVNDAVALRATIEGEGSLQSVDAPVFEPPPGVRVFDSKITEATQRITGTMSSRKTWEWILVPLDPGEVQLPELRFPYFDPDRASYEVARSEPLLLAVERGDRTVDPTEIRGEIRLQRRDLAYIKPLRGRLTTRHPGAEDRPLFHALLLVPVALTPVTIYLGRRRSRMRADLGMTRARRARAKARKQFLAARRKMDQLDSGSFHEEIARTLVEYVADRFNRSSAGMTYELADDLLASKKVDADLRRRYLSCLERCDFARFVPASAQSERRTEVLDEAERVVEQLERAW
jgi:hypothetical protein